ncbi:MAG: hypothetical protein ACRBBR_06565 [Cellvibrionaceae bacterium]
MNYDDLLKLAAYIAHYMPDGWRVDRRPVDTDKQYQGVRILGDHYKAIRLYQSYRSKGKVTISGECPDYGLSWQQQRHAYLPSSSPSINVSPTRNPRHIAADIQRRLLPDYEKMLVKAEEAAQRYKDRIEQIEQVEHVLRCVMPDLRDYHDNRHSTSRTYHIYRPEEGSNYRSGKIETNGYGSLSCDLKLSDVSIDTAIKIMALLQETSKNH